MIERLLAAERALADGDVERSELLFRQVSDADPRNAIAVVGLAVIAERRGDAPGAMTLVERALAIDPEDAAAGRLLEALRAPGQPAEEPGAAPALAYASVTRSEPAPEPTSAAGAATELHRPSLLGWLRRLLRRGR